MTKEQCLNAGGKEIHYTGRHECTRVVGPKGGVKENITRVRASGQCQTWKRDTNRFRLPIKYGLYESWAINQDNCGDFHLASECPLNGK